MIKHLAEPIKNLLKGWRKPLLGRARLRAQKKRVKGLRLSPKLRSARRRSIETKIAEENANWSRTSQTCAAEKERLSSKAAPNIDRAVEFIISKVMP
jgi:hypothetical protein